MLRVPPRLKTHSGPGSNFAMRNAAIGRSVTRAAHSPQWQPETARESKQDGTHSRCAPSSKISITRKPLTALGAGVSRGVATRVLGGPAAAGHSFRAALRNICLAFSALDAVSFAHLRRLLHGCVGLAD